MIWATRSWAESCYFETYATSWELENRFKLRTFTTLLSVQYSLSINVNSQVALHVITLDTFYFFGVLHAHVFTIVLHFKNSETRNF
jgi:hypothetical protein